MRDGIVEELHSSFMTGNREEFSGFSVENRLSESSFIRSDYWSSTCHRLDGGHTEILFSSKIEGRCRVLYKMDECGIIW